ncbi:hypothetical protein Q3G72_028167 [Acer saccharum]|nr:hypothetical protein Q3G72_026977 [Acer saccharum]KAK1548640.1 hypothetical protein Q3G72_028167 [Acer saccharum]
MSEKNTKTMPTQSEQFDDKLRSDLYVAMCDVREKCGDIFDAEQRADEDDLEKAMLALLDIVPNAIDAYFKCIGGGKDLTNGKGMKKTTLIRDACRYFIQQHGETIVIPVKMESELR